MRRVAAIGPMPPPLHGMAFVHAQIVAALADVTTVDVISVTPGPYPRGLRYHASKIARVIAAIPRLTIARARGARALYCAVDAGSGGYYSCLFVVVGRMLGLSLFLHHHNYNYLTERTRPMAWLTTIAGRSARHVVLCERMATDLRAVYPAVLRTIIALNAVGPSMPSVRQEQPDVFRLGLLSNLTPEKGVGEFLTIVDRLRDEGMPVVGRLAGPASPPTLVERVGRLSGDPASGIEWLGWLDPAGKARFFSTIDAFVFPTHMESFGLVLLEALAHGVPIIAPRHGCICLFEGTPAAAIIPVTEDFVTEACTHIRRLADNTGPGLALAARAHAARLGALAQEGQRALVAAITEYEGDLATTP
jgi:glycosyltransferase involved in cell wall biosynthesis